MYQIFLLALLCNTISYGAASSSAAEPPKTAPTELKKTLFNEDGSVIADGNLGKFVHAFIQPGFEHLHHRAGGKRREDYAHTWFLAAEDPEVADVVQNALLDDPEIMCFKRWATLHAQLKDEHEDSEKKRNLSLSAIHVILKKRGFHSVWQMRFSNEKFFKEIVLGHGYWGIQNYSREDSLTLDSGDFRASSLLNHVCSRSGHKRYQVGYGIDSISTREGCRKSFASGAQAFFKALDDRDEKVEKKALGVLFLSAAIRNELPEESKCVLL